ncbi:hypothetical protein GCM10009555_098260 [Acrocarpospora macrocephala]|uniref:Uncharacterized protein n=1 Tax=Acrocarpospora macrocephala TaxID=150177 RepID=A0A5M3X1H5_9ACTN|nr:hypothetical protein [Acrocarpospora macrocephala]GES12593.1 hypothetical protein Amac_061900 [Acrocarpospora macrocephala]
MTVIASEVAEDGASTMKTRIEGNSSGGVAELRNAFELADESRIAALAP